MLPPQVLNPKFFQGFQPGIDILVCTLAGSPIHILAATLTQTPAIFAAHGFWGKGQQKLILKKGVKSISSPS